VSVEYGLGRLRFRLIVSHPKKCKGHGSRLDLENRNECECSEMMVQHLHASSICGLLLHASHVPWSACVYVSDTPASGAEAAGLIKMPLVGRLLGTHVF